MKIDYDFMIFVYKSFLKKLDESNITEICNQKMKDCKVKIWYMDNDGHCFIYFLLIKLKYNWFDYKEYMSVSHFVMICPCRNKCHENLWRYISIAETDIHNIKQMILLSLFLIHRTNISINYYLKWLAKLKNKT